MALNAKPATIVGRTPHGHTIHPYLTLGESIGMAEEVAHGSCTDLPPARK